MPTKTVIIYRLGSLGDTIVALPCLHKVAEAYPDARRIVLTNSPVSRAAPRLADVLNGSGLVHDTIDYPVGTRSLTDLATLWRRLRGLRAETLVYLTAPRGRRSLYRDLAFFRSCGIARIVGAPTTRDRLENRVDAAGEEEYECERLARCLEPLGTVDLESPASWALRLTSDECSKADRMLLPLGGRPFAAINMGGKAAVNDWGHAHWLDLIARVSAAHPDLHWVVVGAAQDSERAESIAAALPGRLVNLCGSLAVRETAAVLARARFFAGHDSGPLHLAAACGIQCVGIFSNLNKPHKWHPYGRQHRILRSLQSIETIPVARVYDAVSDVVQATSVR